MPSCDHLARGVAVAVAVAVACGGGGSPPATEPGGGSVPVDHIAKEAAHHELLRIDQEFHANDDYRIVIDAWIGGTPPQIQRVTMGWLDTGASDRRSPFGKGVRRHVDVLHERRDAVTWVIALVADDVRRELQIVLGDEGAPRIVAQVIVDGAPVRCRPFAGRLVARKVLGIPVALDALELECTDDDGVIRRGTVATSAD